MTGAFCAMESRVLSTQGLGALSKKKNHVDLKGTLHRKLNFSYVSSRLNQHVKKEKKKKEEKKVTDRAVSSRLNEHDPRLKRK